MRIKYFRAAVILFVVGCSSRVRLEPLPYGHPANPEALEGMIAPIGESLSHSTDSSDAMMEPGRQPAAGHHHGMTTATEKSNESSSNGLEKFTCSMHAQVHMNKPGRCPSCGMKLIRKQAEHGEGTHAH